MLETASRCGGSEGTEVDLGRGIEASVSNAHGWEPRSLQESECFGHVVVLCMKDRAAAHSRLEGAVSMEDQRRAGNETGIIERDSLQCCQLSTSPFRPGLAARKTSCRYVHWIIGSGCL